MKKLVSPHTRRLLASLVLFSGSLGVMAAPSFEWPSPGLYRIDSDGTMAFNGNPTEVRLTTEGTTGDTTSRSKSGNASAVRQYQGTGPVTHCVKPGAPGAMPMPPQAGACTVVSRSGTGQVFKQTSNCAFGKFDSTVRKLDNERWEFLTDVTMTSTGAAPDMSAMAPLLKQQARHGATAQDRAQAQRQLAELPRMQQESNAAYAETIARMKEEMRRATDPEEKAAIRAALESMQPGTPTMKTRSRIVWTRIANACAPGQ